MKDQTPTVLDMINISNSVYMKLCYSLDIDYLYILGYCAVKASVYREHNRSAEDKQTYQDWVKTMESIYDNIFHFTRVRFFQYFFYKLHFHPYHLETPQLNTQLLFFPEKISCLRFTGNSRPTAQMTLLLYTM